MNLDPKLILSNILRAGAIARRDSSPRAQPVVSKPHQTGRNDPCPCGSGKKFKRCCHR